MPSLATKLAAWLGCALLLPGVGAAAGQELPETPPPTTRPIAPPLEQLRAEAEDRLRTAAADAPLLSPMPRPIAGVLRITLADDLMQVECTAGETDGFKRVALSDVSGLATLNASPGTPESGRPSFVDFNHVEFDAPGAIAHSLQIFARGDYVQIAWDEATPQASSRIQLIQAPQMADDPDAVVRLYYDRFDAVTEEQLARKQFSARSFPALWAAHRAEVGRLVVEPLRRRGLHAGLLATPPALGWQVLGPTAEPPQEVKARVAELVRQLDAEAFADREAAAESLRQMGSPAAVALRAISPDTLSEEQRRAIDAIVAKYTVVPDAAAKAMARDPAFLIGCLYADDAGLWPLAAEALRRLHGVEVRLGESPAITRAEADRLLDALILDPARSAATRPGSASQPAAPTPN